MNRLKRRALKAINRKLAKVAKNLRAQEPEWEPGAVEEKVFYEYKQRKRDAMMAEIMQIKGKSESEITDEIMDVLHVWGLAKDNIVFRDAALNHLLKLAKRGEWE